MIITKFANNQITPTCAQHKQNTKGWDDAQRWVRQVVSYQTAEPPN